MKQPPNQSGCLTYEAATQMVRWPFKCKVHKFEAVSQLWYHLTTARQPYLTTGKKGLTTLRRHAKLGLNENHEDFSHIYIIYVCSAIVYIYIYRHVLCLCVLVIGLHCFLRNFRGPCAKHFIWRHKNIKTSILKKLQTLAGNLKRMCFLINLNCV